MRTIAAVVAGYALMTFVVVVGLAAAWAMLGADEALVPGEWRASPSWIIGSLAVGMIAAIAGGFVCAVVGRGMRAPRILAAIVFGLGVVMALATLGADAPTWEARPPGDVAMGDAMQHARTPPWVAFANAVVGAVGVLLGARRRAPAE